MALAAFEMMKNVEVKLEPLDPELIEKAQSNGQPKKVPKKRGRPPKPKDGSKSGPSAKKVPKSEPGQELLTDAGIVPVKKKRERFKGTTEEEVLTRKLPDRLDYGLDIVIIGINPGLIAAYTGHYFAGPGNHFWKCLFLSGLIPHAMNAYDDERLLQFGIGFTNIVERTSRGSADLSKKEIQEGAEILKGKIRTFKPKIAVFNGKGIYEVFSGRKDFIFGRQPEPFPGAEETQIFVMPSSSARFTQLPRAVDKVPFYEALKKYRNYLRGEIPKPEDSEITFPDLQLKTAPRKEPQVKKEPEEVKEKKPPVKKPRKKRTSAAKPNVGHITGGSTKLNQMHRSLIEQAMMMSDEPAPTDSSQPPPPAMDFPPQQQYDPNQFMLSHATGAPPIGGFMDPAAPDYNMGMCNNGMPPGGFNPGAFNPPTTTGNNGIPGFNPPTTTGFLSQLQSPLLDAAGNMYNQEMNVYLPPSVNGELNDGVNVPK